MHMYCVMYNDQSQSRGIGTEYAQGGRWEGRE